METVKVKDIALTLNVAVGTVKRWVELQDVPVQYTFDLNKILGQPIDWSKYPAVLKDQFFTPEPIVKECWETFLKTTGVEISKYTFIEPSAGDGSFLKVLPQGSIGMDIEPRGEGILVQDFLEWTPPMNDTQFIIFGNPPFGLRGHTALQFINHSYPFADYIAFILPQLFESDGKGSPRKRIHGYSLIHSHKVSGMFRTPSGGTVKVNGVFQILSKHTTNAKYTIKKQTSCNIKVYSISDGGSSSSTRNKDKIGKCDIYLPSTCFGASNMKVYSTFEELPGRKGYGLIFLKDRERYMSLQIDWASKSFLSTNSALNLRTSLILESLSCGE
jgi:hypothetical protein